MSAPLDTVSTVRPTPFSFDDDPFERGRAYARAPAEWEYPTKYDPIPRYPQESSYRTLTQQELFSVLLKIRAVPDTVRVCRIENLSNPNLGAGMSPIGYYGPRGYLPAPQNDGIGRIAPHEVCAAWPHTFHEWFNADYLHNLQGSGFGMVVLDVDKHAIRCGAYQAVFPRAAARVAKVLIH